MSGIHTLNFALLESISKLFTESFLHSERSALLYFEIVVHHGSRWVSDSSPSESCTHWEFRSSVLGHGSKCTMEQNYNSFIPDFLNPGKRDLFERSRRYVRHQAAFGHPGFCPVEAVVEKRVRIKLTPPCA